MATIDNVLQIATIGLTGSLNQDLDSSYTVIKKDVLKLQQKINYAKNITSLSNAEIKTEYNRTDRMTTVIDSHINDLKAKIIDAEAMVEKYKDLL